MSREIKFRAWNTISDCYAAEDLISISGDGEVDFAGATVTHFYIEQYTGRKSQDGIDVYHNDYVTFLFLNRMGKLRKGRGRVVWDQSMWLIQTQDGDEYSLNRVHSLRIIGNIHENPELLNS